MTFKEFIANYNKADKEKTKLEIPTEMFDDFKELQEGLSIANSQAYEYLKSGKKDLGQSFNAVQIIMFVNDKLMTIYNSFNQAVQMAKDHNKKLENEKKA